MCVFVTDRSQMDQGGERRQRGGGSTREVERQASRAHTTATTASGARLGGLSFSWRSMRVSDVLYARAGRGVSEQQPCCAASLLARLEKCRSSSCATRLTCGLWLGTSNSHAAVPRAALGLFTQPAHPCLGFCPLASDEASSRPTPRPPRSSSPPSLSHRSARCCSQST